MAATAGWGVAVGMALGALLAGPREAPAGPIDFRHGQIRLEAGDEPPQVHPVNFPGTAEYSISAFDAAGSGARLRYDLRDLGGGAIFEVGQDHEGDARGSFIVSFTTDRDFHYALFARPGMNFAAMLDEVVADAFFDALSTEDVYGGSLVRFNEETGEAEGFQERTFLGDLPAGDHVFSMRAFGGIDRGTPISGDGFARLTIAPEAIAIPLPSAARAALLTALGGCALSGASALVRGAFAGGRRRRGNDGRRRRGCWSPAPGGSSSPGFPGGPGAT